MSKFINDVIEKKRREFQIISQNRSVPSAIMNGVIEHRNISYLADGNQAHTLDVFFPADQGGTLPVVINVHGGGLVMGNKEFNRYFCANLCKQGFLVFSIEYRLAPEVTVFRQLDDVTAAIDYVDLVCGQYGGKAGEVFMVGDSAGAFLILYTAAIQRNRKLANVMSVMPAKLPIEKIALISGMFYTTKLDSIGMFLPESLYGKDYRKKPFYPYLDPGHIDVCLSIPPAILFTSRHDNLRRYTRRLANAMAKYNVPYILRDYGSNPSLTHAFPVFTPGLMQSKQAVEEISNFFRGKYNILLE